jgi:hypothetical protein
MKESVERILKAHGYLEIFEGAGNFHVEVKNEPWMKLVIERHGDRVMVSHTFIQNGDVMRDPEIVFLLPTWEAVEITQHPVGHFHEKYRVIDGIRRTNVNFDKNVLPLVRVWARNLKEQGFHNKSCVVMSLTHPQEVLV